MYEETDIKTSVGNLFINMNIIVYT